MTTKIEPNEAKLRELIVYLADKCAPDPRFGAVKLNKLLYFIDAFAFAKFGQPVTGVEYMKQKRGPVPRRMVPAIAALKREGAIAQRTKVVPGVSNPQIITM